MKLNAKKTPIAAAVATSAKTVGQSMLELRRTVACCLLWEDSFYESGESQADRIKKLAAQCPYDFVAQVAIEARVVHGLRHVPLLLARELARHPGRHAATDSKLKDVLPKIITRADQLGEFVQLYWATNYGKKSLPAQVKKGLATAFERFDAYALAKNDHQSAIVKLRDVAFLVHARQAKGSSMIDAGDRVTVKERTYKDAAGATIGTARLARLPGSTLDQLCEGKLPTPDTWETRLSAAGKDPEARRRAWFDLLATSMLGGLAWLRNLRLMDKDGVPQSAICAYGESLAMNGKLKGIFPHQFLTAARVCPWAEPTLERLVLNALEGATKLRGRTVVLVDVSGSMDAPLSKNGLRGDDGPTRLDTALGLAVAAREVCEEVAIFTFSEVLIGVADHKSPLRGFALARAVAGSQSHGGTYLRAALERLRELSKIDWDRTLIITDEQSTDGPPGPALGRGYVMNIAGYDKTIAAGPTWTSISGWSSGVLQYINLAEAV
jgi:hypothetical protein